MMKKSSSEAIESASGLVDERIEKLGDWRGEMLSRLRALIKQADPDVVEEYRGRAVARVKDAFGWGGIADTYEALFQKLVEIP